MSKLVGSQRDPTRFRSKDRKLDKYINTTLKNFFKFDEIYTITQNYDKINNQITIDIQSDIYNPRLTDILKNNNNYYHSFVKSLNIIISEKIPNYDKDSLSITLSQTKIYITFRPKKITVSVTPIEIGNYALLITDTYSQLYDISIINSEGIRISSPNKPDEFLMLELTPIGYQLNDFDIPHKIEILNKDDFHWRNEIIKTYGENIANEKPIDITYQQQHSDLQIAKNQIPRDETKAIDQGRTDILLLYLSPLGVTSFLALLFEKSGTMYEKKYVKDPFGGIKTQYLLNLSIQFADYAAKTGNIKILQFLNKLGIHPSLKGVNIAAEEGQKDVLLLLNEWGIRPDITGAYKALRKGHTEIIELLSQWGLYTLSPQLEILNKFPLIRKYSKYFDEVINYGLRNKKLSQKSYDIIKEIIEALNEVEPFTHNLILYRGATATSKYPIDTYVIGATISDLGFMSKTPIIDVALNFIREDPCCLLKIKYPSGSRQINISAISEFSSETEHLSYPGEIFKIVDITKTVISTTVSVDEYKTFELEYVGNMYSDLNTIASLIDPKIDEEYPIFKNNFLSDLSNNIIYIPSKKKVIHTNEIDPNTLDELINKFDLAWDSFVDFGLFDSEEDINDYIYLLYITTSPEDFQMFKIN